MWNFSALIFTKINRSSFELTYSSCADKFYYEDTEKWSKKRKMRTNCFVGQEDDQAHLTSKSKNDGDDVFDAQIV